MDERGHALTRVGDQGHLLFGQNDQLAVTIGASFHAASGRQRAGRRLERSSQRIGGAPAWVISDGNRHPGDHAPRLGRAQRWHGNGCR